jgi:sugar O-acyltransferase (sialic acid O-acetyltransferase NeuD family)
VSAIIRDKSIHIVGGGGHASDVLNVIERLGLIGDVAGCLDDRSDPARMRRWGIAYLGGVTGGRLAGGLFILGIGTPAVKAKVLESLDHGAAQALTLVDPTALIGHGAEMGNGTVVMPGGCVSTHAELGSHCLVGHNSVIGHDTVLGERCSVMPGAAVSGDCELGDEVLIGSNAVVLQGVTLGTGVVVGAGAVVTRHVGAGVTVVGVPARPTIG